MAHDVIAPLDKSWTQDQDELLKRLILDGKSGAQIAAIIRTTRPDCTRNAVIGRAHRLKTRIMSRHKNIRNPWSPVQDQVLRDMWGKHPVATICNAARRGKRATWLRAKALGLTKSGIRNPPGEPQARSKVPTAPVPDRFAAPRPDMPRLWELGPHDCRWPFGQDDMTFCGERQQEGSSYCPYHHQLSYRCAPLSRFEISGAVRV